MHPPLCVCARVQALFAAAQGGDKEAMAGVEKELNGKLYPSKSSHRLMPVVYVYVLGEGGRLGVQR